MHDSRKYQGRVEADRRYYGTGDARKVKRIERKIFGFSENYYAHTNGGYDGHLGKPKNNPYPPGKRHDAYEHGYNSADPMGDHHGRNV